MVTAISAETLARHAGKNVRIASVHPSIIGTLRVDGRKNCLVGPKLLRSGDRLAFASFHNVANGVMRERRLQVRDYEFTGVRSQTSANAPIWNVVTPENLIGRIRQGQKAFVIRRGREVSGPLRVESEGSKVKFYAGQNLIKLGEVIRLRVARIVPRNDGTNKKRLVHTYSSYEFQEF
jgi:hypothetical protein